MRREQLSVGTLFRSGATNADAILVTERDSSNFVTSCHGTIAAPSATAGYQVGCKYLNTSTAVEYVNVGTTTSCTFRVGPVVPDDSNGKKYTLSSDGGVLALVEV